jgi:hypothetical protein
MPIVVWSFMMMRTRFKNIATVVTSLQKTQRGKDFSASFVVPIGRLVVLASVEEAVLLLDVK